MMVYAIIEAIDGNVIVPVLFPCCSHVVPMLLSEAVNLHPVVIIVSVLIFEGLWGFWGVFFAIPLATTCKGGIKCLAEHTSEG